MADRTRTHEEPTIRRAQILREGLSIVGELGYYGFTIQALAERCKISNPGLLYYFGSKDKLLLALLDEIESRMEDRMAPLVAMASRDSSSAEEAYAATAALMSAMVAQFREDPTLARFVAALQLESLHADHPAHDWFQARENETLELFTRLVAPWSKTPLSTARQVYALMHGIGQQWLRANQGFDIEEEWVRAFDLIVPRPKAA